MTQSFFGNLLVKEFWKLVYICRSYDQKSSVLFFFDSHCSIDWQRGPHTITIRILRETPPFPPSPIHLLTSSSWRHTSCYRHSSCRGCLARFIVLSFRPIVRHVAAFVFLHFRPTQKTWVLTFSADIIIIVVVAVVVLLLLQMYWSRWYCR